MFSVVRELLIMVKTTPNHGEGMNPKAFFAAPQNTTQKQYEALRAFYIGSCTAQEAAQRFDYTLHSFYSLVRDFKKKLSTDNTGQFFFSPQPTGRKPKDTTGEINDMIIDLRKKYLSVPDIKSVLDGRGYKISEKYVYNLLSRDGFTRLPRRDSFTRKEAASSLKLQAPRSEMLDFTSEKFNAQNTLGIMCVLPLLQEYGIDEIIRSSGYPETKTIDRISSVLSFIALKLSDVRRYTTDDVWCMDRGLGLFAGLNVLPKAAWYTSYSDRVTRKTNRSFLQKLNAVWIEYGLLSDTANLDFTAVPYWGDDSHLENNWSGKRRKSLPSMLAALSQDPDSGIITYGDTTVRHRNESDVCVEFLDFYKSSGDSDLRYLVFDSKFTTYGNLGVLSKDVKFVTIRRRGKNIVDDLNRKPASQWKKVRVATADGKGRTLKVFEENIRLRDYGGTVRQIAITGHGKIKPALIITNDFDLPCKDVVRKYVRRWIVEKGISEQIDFFHLNRVSSSMVIKVDFDFTMSILAHNLLRLLAIDLPGYSHDADHTLYNRFLSMSGSVEIDLDQITVKIKKKRNLPALLTAMEPFQNQRIALLDNKRLVFEGDTRS